MQAIFFIIGIISAYSIRSYIHIQIGGLALAIHFLSMTTEFTLPIFLILLSDLAMNTEIVEGTFTTHLLMGKSQREWFLKRFLLFTFFVMIQFFLAGIVSVIGSGLIRGQFGMEGLKKITDVQAQTTIVGVTSGITMNLLKSIFFVSLAVFVSTLFPGKLFVGTSVSMVMIFITLSVLKLFRSSIFMNKPLLYIAETMTMVSLKRSWWFAIAVILAFWLLSYLKIKSVKLTNQGA